MHGKKHSLIKLFFGFICALWLAGRLVAPASAGGSLWKDVPDELKHQPGVRQRGEYLYATGMARLAAGARQDITSEFAQKKSLLRAMQLLRMGTFCKSITSKLNQNDLNKFFLNFSHLAKSIRIEGIEIVRQWEENGNFYSTVVAPMSAFKDIICDFIDIRGIISSYLEAGSFTMQGLDFCLKYTSPYSALHRSVRQYVAQMFIKKYRQELALCFIVDLRVMPEEKSLDTLIYNNRVFRAASLVEKAEDFAGKGKWSDACKNVSAAMAFVQNFGRAYLVLADYFYHEMKLTSFALCAIEKAFKDGTCFSAALKRKIDYLTKTNSPEADIYQFLLAQSRPLPDWEFYSFSEACPDAWKPEIKKMAGKRIVNLVAFSLGQAIEGNPKPPDAEFSQAVTLFNQAKTDQDVNRVLDLLFSACEKQPASPKTYNLIGACYRHLGKYEMALPFLWQALTLEPEYDFALTNLALCCRSLGLEESARYYFEHNAVKSSKNKWVQENYAEFKDILGHR